MLYVSKLFAFVCFVFHGAAPIHYVQMVILNLPYPYLRTTTVLLDKVQRSSIISFGCGFFEDGNTRCRPRQFHACNIMWPKENSSVPVSITAGLMGLLTASFDAGVTAFNCGDIYTGVKELYGKMMVAHTELGGRQQLGQGRSHKACPRFGRDF